MNKKEKDDFFNLVDTMTSLKINFAKKWTNLDPRFSAAPEYALQPAIRKYLDLYLCVELQVCVASSPYCFPGFTHLISDRFDSFLSLR